jgi:Methyltransferase domain
LSENAASLRTLRERAHGKAHMLRRRYLQAFFDLPNFPLGKVFGGPARELSPVLEECFLPPYLGPKDHDDFEPLMRIVRSLDPSVVVELGTAFGNTVANICNVCKGAKIYTVNALPEHQTGSLVTCELTVDEIGRVYRARGFGERVVQIYENTLSLDLAKYFDGPVVDLAIIDACHDTNYVINDFVKVRDFVRPGGVVLFHDTHPSMVGHLEGSYVACMKLRSRGFDIRHIRGTWWAAWQAP